MKVSCVPRLILSAFSWMFNSGCTHVSMHNLKDAHNEQCVRVSMAHVLQIRHSCHFPSLPLQRIICCCVRRASCQTWCEGTKTTLMMVDSRKGQQVVQLVCPMLRWRNIIKSNISQSRAEKFLMQSGGHSAVWYDLDARVKGNKDDLFYRSMKQSSISCDGEIHNAIKKGSDHENLMPYERCRTVGKLTDAYRYLQMTDILISIQKNHVSSIQVLGLSDFSWTLPMEE